MIVGKKVKFRIDHVFTRPAVPVFSKYEDEYQLDVENDKLVKVGQIDTQEIIESSIDCALSHILDKYLPEQVEKITNQNITFVDGQHERVNSDLSDLGAEYERVNDLKVKYKLDESLNYFDTLKELQKIQLELSEHINILQSQNIKDIVNKDLGKEDNGDEKKKNE